MVDRDFPFSFELDHVVGDHFIGYGRPAELNASDITSGMVFKAEFRLGENGAVSSAGFDLDLR